MTCTRLSSRGFSGIICTTPDYKPGDQAPEGYLAWHEWAEVQHKAGLRQNECGRCGKWKYPQELSDQIDRHEAKSRKGLGTVETAVCLHCVTPVRAVAAKTAPITTNYYEDSNCGLPRTD